MWDRLFNSGKIKPRVARVTMVFDPAMAPFASYYLNPFKAAAASFGIEAIVAPVHDSRCLRIACQKRIAEIGTK